jgi:TadE-like protein
MHVARRSRAKDRANRAKPRGQALVEMALVLPLLLMLVLGIIDFGAVFNSYHELRSASRDGARVAVVDNGCFPGSVDNTPLRCPAGNTVQQLANLKADIRARATGLADRNTIAIEVCYPAILPHPLVGVDNVEVRLTYPASSLTGFFGFLLNGITLESKAVMRLEQAPTFGKDPSCAP